MNDIVIRPAVIDQDLHYIASESRQEAILGVSYIFDSTFKTEDYKNYWFQPNTKTFVVEVSGKLAGFFLIRPVLMGRGKHIANASFIVGSHHRRLGLGKIMGLEAIKRARELGYQGMQFNAVVASNKAAVNLWEGLGFNLVGKIPLAFKFSEGQFSDLNIYYRDL